MLHLTVSKSKEGRNQIMKAVSNKKTTTSGADKLRYHHCT